MKNQQSSSSSSSSSTTHVPPKTNHIRKATSQAAIWLMFGIGLMTTMLAPLLVGNVIYVLARIVVPATTLPGTFFRHFHIAAISFLSFGIVFNFIMACAVHPGTIPQVYLDAAKTYLHSNPKETLRECSQCHIPKAPRSHHCVMCGECILKMDHHCPWINQCCGYHNYRYFFGFLFWLLTGTIYSAISCAHMLWFHSSTWHHAFDKVASETNQVFFIFVLTVSIALTMCLYVGFNIYEIYYNQTAVEVHISKEIAAEGYEFRNPYDLGYVRNAVECLGPETFKIPKSVPTSVATPLRLFLLMLPNIQLMPHEGVWYPVNQYTSDDSV